jgi:hypothetical protein
LSGSFEWPLYTGLNIFKLGHIDHAEIIMKLLVCGKHLYDHILSSRGVVRIHKISLPPPHLKCLYQARKVVVMCISFRVTDYTSVSEIFHWILHLFRQFGIFCFPVYNFRGKFEIRKPTNLSCIGKSRNLVSQYEYEAI